MLSVSIRKTMTVNGAERGPGRIPWVDTARGIAVWAMIIYHVSFDSAYLGLVNVDFHHNTFWLTARIAIVTSFVSIAGISLSLATRSGFDPTRYFRRLVVLALCAATVSLASAWLAPERLITFGILHFITVVSVLGLVFLHCDCRTVLVAALLALLAPLWHGATAFDSAWLNWTGLAAHPPVTLDFVPLLPWLGVYLFGMVIGRRYSGPAHHAAIPPGVLPKRSISLRIFRMTGRHSLMIYMLHQPLILAALVAYIQLITQGKVVMLY